MSNNNPILRSTATELITNRFADFNQNFKFTTILNGRYSLIENETMVCEKFIARDQLDHFKMYDF
jgi:hypothetical protein